MHIHTRCKTDNRYRCINKVVDEGGGEVTGKENPVEMEWMLLSQFQSVVGRGWDPGSRSPSWEEDTGLTWTDLAHSFTI